MKRLACMLLAAVCTAVLTAAEPYVCTRPGTTLHYVRRYAENGRVKWVHDLKVSRVERSADGSLRVFTSSTFTKENGRPYYRNTVREQATVSADGTVTSDFGDAAAAFASAVAGITMKGSGSTTAMAPDLKPGDALPDLQATFGMGPVRYNVRVTERKVLRRETITVPAGTFDCIVISESKSEDGPAHHRLVTTLSWYAPGTGYVRHDTFAGGALETTEQLE